MDPALLDREAGRRFRARIRLRLEGVTPRLVVTLRRGLHLSDNLQHAASARCSPVGKSNSRRQHRWWPVNVVNAILPMSSEDSGNYVFLSDWIRGGRRSQPSHVHRSGGAEDELVRPWQGRNTAIRSQFTKGRDDEEHAQARGARRKRTTAANDVLCALCGSPMRGRRPQARYCSDACRARGSRQERDRCLTSLLDGITRAVDELRRELDLSGADRGTGAAEQRGVHRDG